MRSVMFQMMFKLINNPVKIDMLEFKQDIQGLNKEERNILLNHISSIERSIQPPNNKLKPKIKCRQRCVN